MKYAGITDVGSYRSENQDDYKISAISSEILIVTVCDGVGGSYGGKEASKLAIKSYHEHLEDFIYDNLNKQKTKILATDFDILHIMRDSVEYANMKVINFSLSDPAYSKMGTTIVSALITKDKIYVVNAGDSRLYYQTPKKLIKHTKDHTLVQYLMDKNGISREEALREANSHTITKAIGAYDYIDPDTSIIDLTKKEIDKLLLCSDGLYNLIPQRNLSILLRTSTTNSTTEITKLTKTLIDTANKNGGFDNITAIVVKL